jgi:hypothetical protein
VPISPRNRCSASRRGGFKKLAHDVPALLVQLLVREQIAITGEMPLKEMGIAAHLPEDRQQGIDTRQQQRTRG